MGVHHAWGRTYKDVFQRYFAGTGHELRYQNGFDCQGLWVEVEVEKEHGFGCKREIEEYGVDKFVTECKERARKYAAIQTGQSKRLGYWMDWDNSYYTMSEENNYSIWAFLKKCHEKGLVYKGFDVMPWCPRCGTGISQMEMNEGYKVTSHLSIFVKFPIKGKDNENLLVWTTTPWTLSSNVGAAVKADMAYLKIRQNDEIFYVGKANFENSRSQPALDDKLPSGMDKSSLPSLMAINALFKNNGDYEILEELKGEDLVGLEYIGPFDHLDGAAEAREAHRVIPWDHVTETEGTGIVHIAPGCGGDDYQLGKELGLPQIAPLLEDGRFRKEFGFLADRHCGEVHDDVVADLKERNRLFAKEQYYHRYPHCWRCKDELVYRLVDEWYIRMDWREKIMESTRQAKWIPEWGLDRELDWLRNMGDWMISKKRYWGLALPIWECHECGHFEVIGGRNELEARAISGWAKFVGNSPHKPWIDNVKIRCSQCGHDDVSRVNAVGNPWLDASIVPFSTMGYFSDHEYWKQWFPADFIVECLPGQFRNWFYALLAISTMMEDCAPFKTILGHGLVMDDNMEDMHKSKGNAIEFNSAADDIGVDVMRWMYCAHAPERNLAFGPAHADEVRKRILIPLWNVYSFFSNYARLDGFDPSESCMPVKDRSDLDRWIISDLQLLIRTANTAFPKFDTLTVCQEVERFVENLSTWYVRRSRRRFWKSDWSDDKRAAYQTLYEVLTTLSQVISPIIVFASENMYQNLVASQNPDAPRSIHLCDYPQADDALIDSTLSERMAAFLNIVSMARAARAASKLKVRQPLAQVIIKPGTTVEKEAIEQFQEHLLEELNVKSVALVENVDDMLTVKVEVNKKLAGRRLGKDLPAVIKSVLDMDAQKIADTVAKGESVSVSAPGQTFVMEPAEINVTFDAGADWAANVEAETAVIVDKRLTKELIQEGVARDVVRNVQNLRKDANYNIEDRIALSVRTEDKDVSEAVLAFKGYICEETLANDLVDSALTDDDVETSVVKIGKASITLEVVRQ